MTLTRANMASSGFGREGTLISGGGKTVGQNWGGRGEAPSCRILDSVEVRERKILPSRGLFRHRSTNSTPGWESRSTFKSAIGPRFVTRHYHDEWKDTKSYYVRKAESGAKTMQA
jgi:hypothetical protein